MAAHREHPKDILLVKNIDIGCTSIEEAMVPVQRRARMGDKVISREVNMSIRIDHKQWFEVRLDRRAYRIMAGQTKRMSRDIAEHFAKHLADHILMKQEIADTTMQEGIKVRPNYVRNPSKRVAVLKQILIGVEEWFQDNSLDYDATQGQNPNFENYDAYAEEMLGEEDGGGQNLGVVGKPMMHGLDVQALELPTINADIAIDDLSERVDEAVIAPIEVGEPDAMPTPTIAEVPKLEDLKKPELLAQAMGLGLEVSGKENKEELLALIQSNT